jgi:hypothetical protein
VSGKRLALGVLVTALGISALGSASNSFGQTSPEPGTTYGGLRFGESVWLRLDETRTVILALELPWAAERRRCSNRKAYSSTLFTGAEYDEPIAIRSGGQFRRTVLDDYRFGGSRYQETQTVKGTLATSQVTGTIEGKVRITQPNGRVVRCTFGPQRWTAID